MKKTWNIARILLILAAIAASYILIIRSYQIDIERMRNNLLQAMNDNNSQLLQLTKKEFKDIKRNDSAFKHQLDTLGIKFKHIERTITHNYILRVKNT